MTDGFHALVAADLEQRRAQLDQLDPHELATDRASVLVLHDDGCVEAVTVLAGPDGPARHIRTLPAAVVAELAAAQPPRWRGAQQVTTGRRPGHPAAALLAGWDLAPPTQFEEPARWAALLTTDQPPASH